MSSYLIYSQRTYQSDSRPLKTNLSINRKQLKKFGEELLNELQTYITFLKIVIFWIKVSENIKNQLEHGYFFKQKMTVFLFCNRLTYGYKKFTV